MFDSSWRYADESPQEKSDYTQNSFVDENMKTIFSFPDKKERLLCIGEVQSGKTRNIISSIRFAFENGYGSAVFLGGTNNCLNNQSRSRFQDESDSWGSQNSKRKIRIIDSFSGIDNNLIRAANDNDFVVFVILKGERKLENLEKYFLKNINLFSEKTLLIDDESDYASVFVKDQNANKIHNLIENIFSKMKSGKFLSITATPFANVLSSERKHSLTYDRFVLLEHNSEYTGCDFFLELKNFYVTSEFKKNDWKKMIDEALSVWLISTSVFRLNENENIKSEFLINVDLSTPTHQEIKKWVESRLIFMHEYPTNRFWKESLKKHYPEETRTNEVFGCASKIVNDLLSNIDQKIILLNGLSNVAKTFVSDRATNAIVIGGHLLSRGVTFKNLITEMFLNSPEDAAVADTTLQRCRWFGYRRENNQYKYMRVFINNVNLKAINDSNFLISKIKKLPKHSPFSDLINLIHDYNKIEERAKLTSKK